MEVVPEKLVVTITGVVAGGDGIGRHPDGRVVFVDGALPGERVHVEVREERRDFLKASLPTPPGAALIDVSPERIEPPCPWVGAGCGGCPWQHAMVASQIRLKSAIVIDALRRLAHIEHIPVVVGPSVPPAGYRTAARLGVDSGGRAGYRRRYAHDLVAVDSCLVAHPLLSDLIVNGRFPNAREVTLKVGARTGQRLVFPQPASAANAVVVESDVVVARKARTWISEQVAGRRWRVSATSFFQSGPEAAEILIAAVERAIATSIGPEPQGTVVDAYCGVGLLGGALAAAHTGLRVVGIESHAVTAADAVANLVDLDASVVIAEVADHDMWGRGLGGAEVVVADPARTGLGASAAAALAWVGAPALVLVSCDPASLARDARLLGGHGYRLAGVEVLDLFPHTFHVETVSRFERTERA